MSAKAIFKHFLKDPRFSAELIGKTLGAEIENPDGETCVFLIREEESEMFGKSVTVFAPINISLDEIDLNILFSHKSKHLNSYLGSWWKYGLSVNSDDLYFQQIFSSDQDPIIVRRAAVLMAFAANSLSKLLSEKA